MTRIGVQLCKFAAMYAIVDIETTGSRVGSDKIIEIAIVKHDGKQIVDSFSSLINPEIGIPYFITQLTGINSEMLQNAPRFYEVAKQIVEFTEGCIFVAHNVRFDYSFVKREFLDLGFHYHRKRLCTVRLSRKLIPGLKSYSLGRLADSLGFSIAKEERHRAYGDAYATAQIFGLLLERSSDLMGPQLEWAIEDEIKSALLPPAIPAEKVEAIPQTAGVYLFHGQNGEPIYIGKARNIRKRIYEHFKPDHKSNKDIHFKNFISEVTYQETGNELTALLLENHLVKQHKPQYNVALKRSEFTYGLFYDFTKTGYIRFFIKRAAKNSQLVTPLSEKVNKRAYLENLVLQYNLCQSLCEVHSGVGRCMNRQFGICLGACVGAEEVETYNERAMKVIVNHSFPEPSFFIFGKGRTLDEQTVVWVEDGFFKGWGFFDPQFNDGSIGFLKMAVDKYPHDKDAQTIIRAAIKKIPESEILYYQSELQQNNL